MVYTIISAQPSEDKRVVEIEWSDRHCSRFHVKWLRFYCRCEACQPKYKGTYLVDIPAFPDVLTAERIDIDEKGAGLSIKIAGDIVDGHVCWHKSQWLRERCYCDECLANVVKNRDVISKNGIATGNMILPTVEYQDILDDPDRTVFKWLEHVIMQGYCLVKNVPNEHKMVIKMAKIMGGTLRETCYGQFFDVDFSKKKHGNNNEVLLPCHQDQASYEWSPGVVLLHCLRFDEEIRGGLSKLMDFFHAAEILAKESPEDFKTLTEVPGSWDTINYNLDHPSYQEQQKYHIVLDYFGKVVGVNWNPDLTSPVRIKEKDVERYYRAHKKFSEIIEREENKVVFRLVPGDVITINNRRCAHARTQIENMVGLRHLQGGYTNLDDVKSRYMYLGHKLGLDPIPPKVGNNCSF